MKIREIISEAISFTTLKHDIEEGLNEIGEMSILDVIKLIDTHYGHSVSDNPPKYMVRNFHKGMNENIVKEHLQEIVSTATVGIQQAYANLCSKLLGIPDNSGDTLAISIDDQTGGAGGSAQRFTGKDDKGYYNTHRIKFYLKGYTNFKEYDVDMLFDKLLDFGAFEDDPHAPSRIVLNDSYQYYINQLFNVKLKEFAVFDKINSPGYIDVMIHELVHVRQHMNQPKTSKDPKTGEDKIKNTEYRSKVEPNPAKFRAATNALFGKTQTPEEFKIYMSALQEIPAFAHTAALNIVKSFEFEPEYGVDYLREQVKGLIKATRSLTLGMKVDDYNLINIWPLDYYIKTFNHPEDNKLYPVYKKFIKILHQELVNYIQYWVNKINEYESNKQGK